jgi:hypothetical protein
LLRWLVSPHGLFAILVSVVVLLFAFGILGCEVRVQPE